VILIIRGWQGWLLEEHCGVGSGSGCVVVVPLDRKDQCGSNGVRYVVWQWLGGSWDRIGVVGPQDGAAQGGGRLLGMWLTGHHGVGSGSGWVVVPPLNRGDQCGHFDTS
jgi:hypothetical protein